MKKIFLMSLITLGCIGRTIPTFTSETTSAIKYPPLTDAEVKQASADTKNFDKALIANDLMRIRYLCEYADVQEKIAAHASYASYASYQILDRACSYANINLITYLLETQKFTYNDFAQAFITAARRKSLDIMKLLVAHGSKEYGRQKIIASQAELSGGYVQNALRQAVLNNNLDMVSYLLEQGITQPFIDDALHTAVLHNMTNITSLLLTYDAPITEDIQNMIAGNITLELLNKYSGLSVPAWIGEEIPYKLKDRSEIKRLIQAHQNLYADEKLDDDTLSQQLAASATAQASRPLKKSVDSMYGQNTVAPAMPTRKIRQP